MEGYLQKRAGAGKEIQKPPSLWLLVFNLKRKIELRMDTDER
jgi:hypothetical protein